MEDYLARGESVRQLINNIVSNLSVLDPYSLILPQIEVNSGVRFSSNPDDLH